MNSYIFNIFSIYREQILSIAYDGKSLLQMMGFFYMKKVKHFIVANKSIKNNKKSLCIKANRIKVRQDMFCSELSS